MKRHARKAFTVRDGLDIQTEQLSRWKELLNEKSYLLLLEEIAKQNKLEMRDGYAVFRGSDIDTFVHNLYSRIIYED